MTALLLLTCFTRTSQLSGADNERKLLNEPQVCCQRTFFFYIQIIPTDCEHLRVFVTSIQRTWIYLKKERIEGVSLTRQFDLFTPVNLCTTTTTFFVWSCLRRLELPPGCLERGHSAMVTHSKFDSAMSSSLLDSSMRLPHRYKTFASKTQYQMVLATLHKLQESGFYWGAITGKEANAMLAAEATGTFIVRDSSDNRHLFALSVKTASGTKNLRIQCDATSFYLQTDPKNIQSVPHFDCVLKLVHFYMPQSKGNTRSGNMYYIYSGGEKIPLELVRPLSCSLSTLQHLCRKTVNGHLDISSRRDQLPHPLKEFLQEYDAPI